MGMKRIAVTAVLTLLAAPLALAAPGQPNWAVTGIVVSGATLSPVQGTPLKLVAWPTGHSIATTVSGSDGSFAFAVSGGGTYSVLAQPGDGQHAEKSSPLVRLSERARSAEISIRLARSTTAAQDLEQERALLEAARIRGDLGTEAQESDPANLGLESGETDIRIISRPPPDNPPRPKPPPAPAPPGGGGGPKGAPPGGRPSGPLGPAEGE
jgi:hypothetical protein